MYVNNKQIETVNQFKYLGLEISNNSVKPDTIIIARLAAAKRIFNAVQTNCRILGISNVRVKLQMIYALVSSVLLYGSIVYACMSDVHQTLTPKNALFSDVEIFLRRMIRWVFSSDYDTRRSFLYVFAN